MNKLQRLSELAQIQAKFMPQMKAAQAAYQAIPPKTLSHLQKISVSPTYRTMMSLPVHQLEHAAESARITQNTEILVNSFLLAFETLSDEEQRAIIDSAASIEVPKAVFERCTDETMPSKKHSFHVDLPCSAHILPKDIDSAWMQIRKAMYPIVHGNLAATISLCSVLLNAYGLSDPALKNLFVVLSVVVFVVSVAGDPDKTSR